MVTSPAGYCAVAVTFPGISFSMIFRNLFDSFLEWTDQFVPPEFQSNPDLRRHSRLIVNFGLVGGIFGTLFSCFYLVLQHYWGAGIVLVCTVGLLAIGFGRFRSLNLAGNLVAFTLTVGFAGLASVEGGVEGHAVGWLATIPISALVLANQRSGILWFAISLCCTLFFSQYYSSGRHMPILYQARWHPTVTAVGYVSLTLFTGILGFIIESGRKSAFRRMELALEHLSEANADLLELNKEKTDIMQVVAHDLRSPLQAIMGHGALISEGFVTDKLQIQASGGQIVKTSRKMSDLITNLLDLNAIEEGRFAINLESVNLSEMMAEVVIHHVFVAQNKDIKIEWLSPPLPVYVMAARMPLSQVLDNLLSNAVKYSPKQTVIVVSMESRDGKAVISVKDQGPGLSKADQAKLFQKFTRLTSQPTGGESSSGLGLSIAKKMTESMGGTIGCNSRLGDGCTFYIELPLSP